jgi:hypothetical protein
MLATPVQRPGAGIDDVGPGSELDNVRISPLVAFGAVCTHRGSLPPEGVGTTGDDLCRADTRRVVRFTDAFASAPAMSVVGLKG